MRDMRPLLLTRVREVAINTVPVKYCNTRDLSIDEATGKPFVLSQAGPTYSKTAARPGDDDPDPGQDRCY